MTNKRKLEKPTVGAVVVHQDNVSEEVRRSPVDDAIDGSLDDGQGLIKVDQHSTNGGQILWVLSLQTPRTQSKTANDCY